RATVTFCFGLTSPGTAPPVTLHDALPISTLAVGAHSLTVAYGGDAGFAASTSALVTQTVNLGPTSTTLTPTPNPSVTGQPVTLNASVSPVAPAAGVPTGTATSTGRPTPPA